MDRTEQRNQRMAQSSKRCNHDSHPDALSLLFSSLLLFSSSISRVASSISSHEGRPIGNNEQNIAPLIGVPCNPEQVKLKGCLSGECRNDNGQLRCACQPGYYGELCQFKNFCDLLLVPEEQLTGQDICDKWTRKSHCIAQEAIAQRFLRCQCDKQESFVYLNKTFYSQQAWAKLVRHINTIAPHPTTATSASMRQDPNEHKYLARCIPADVCYGRKCRHLSEVCVAGTCECNAERGYWSLAGECKLVSPCSAQQDFDPSGQPLCGSARCVPTYDKNLYQCVCPPGKHAVELIPGHRNTTTCLETQIPIDNDDSDDSEGGGEDEPMRTSDQARGTLVCENPILNPCEHICEPQDNDHPSGDAFICSCLPGYELGKTHETKHQCFYSKDLTWGAGSESVADASAPPPSQECKRRLGCREHELCVAHANGHEECHCERQGFVQQASESGGSACVDWCWAAQQDVRLANLLDPVCLSGICGMVAPDMQGRHTGKPIFECDCSESKRLVKNERGLCELNFTAVLEPCMPGNDGYQDCVINKGAYCSVMHQDVATLRDELRSARRLERITLNIGDNGADSSSKIQARRYFYDKDFVARKRREKMLLREQTRILNKNINLYACVCPPDRRMIVDRERGRAICIKECQLMTDRCSRMNRMCKRAQFDPFDTSYKQRNLIRRDWNSSYPPGSQWLIDLQAASCDCLPGFLPAEDGKGVSSPLVNSNLTTNWNAGTSRFVATHSNYVAGDTARDCFMGDDVIRLVNVSFKAPANFDLTWLRPINESLWNEWDDPIANTNDSGHQDAQTVVDATTNPDSPSWFIPRQNDLMPEQPNWTRLRDPNFLTRHLALVGECDPTWAQLGSIRMYYECVSYRYWQEHVLKRHFVDWRRILKAHLRDSFNFMRGFVEINIDICKSIVNNRVGIIDIADDSQILDGDVFCNLTLHIANATASKINIGPEMKQLIYDEKSDIELADAPEDTQELSTNYAWLSPNALITKDSYKNIQKEAHYPDFRPCHNTEVSYCSNSTQCITGNGIRFECKCAPGFQPVSAIDIGSPGSQYKREICEDIDECLFDVCGENTLRCRNLIGDYKCDCLPKYVLDGRNCVPMCDKVNCKNGICRFQGDYHANCECEDGYIGPDCGQLDPSIALRKANIIICISIFGSILVLAITVAFSQRKQLNKARKELKQLRAENDPMRMYEFYVRQAPPLKTHRSKTGHPNHHQWNSQRSLMKT